MPLVVSSIYQKRASQAAAQSWSRPETELILMEDVTWSPVWLPWRASHPRGEIVLTKAIEKTLVYKLACRTLRFALGLQGKTGPKMQSAQSENCNAVQSHKSYICMNISIIYRVRKTAHVLPLLRQCISRRKSTFTLRIRQHFRNLMASVVGISSLERPIQLDAYDTH